MKRILLAATLLLAPAAWAQSIAGLWDAKLDLGGTQIPFRMGFSGTGSDVKGWFFNGDDKEISNAGKLENGAIALNFDSYAAQLKGTFQGDAFDGEYLQRGKRFGTIHATRSVTRPAASGNVPNIDGIWYLENVRSSKKDENAWQFIVSQKGADVAAAILRVDGDTGTLTGSWQDGKFELSHFSGARAALLYVTPQADGSLAVELAGQRHEGAMTALRPEAARAKGLPEPTDADLHTTVKDLTKPFVFSFTDLDGHVVSNIDAQFKNKVVLINVTGSWCPNCHDESPFLAKLYDKYHAQGLEVVALDFEEADQLKDPVRLKALMKEYGIHYTVLLGGETNSAKEKLVSAQDWDAWPTTFFVGRDGLVKAVHAGFPSAGSGPVYKQETSDFVTKIERLLAANETPEK
ncbi:MAG: TlpA disulfide reductase family protein [Bryobacteraceae bacterium]|jgi:thiol-disulfide isomerase/thioredoxin